MNDVTDSPADEPRPIEEPQAGGSQIPSDAQAAAPAATLGLLLRKAREARGLAIADVVAALKFSPRQIEALEADQLDQLPGNVFVRGIVRGYARLLKLDPVPLLALLEHDVPGVPQDVSPPEDMGVAMPAASRQIPAAVTLAVLVAVAAVAFGIWHFLAPVATAPGTAVEQALVQSPVTAPLAVAVVPPVQPKDSAPVAPAVTESPQAPPQGGTTDNVAPTTMPVAAAPEVPGGKQLTFAFHGTSWVEVKDASQQIIFTGQFGPGSQQVISGRPPFQVVIGNAPEVELKYADEKIDLAPYIRAEVARLTLE